MRNLFAKLASVAVIMVTAFSLAGGVMPALADATDSTNPIDATDGRFNPQFGDRLAVYLKDSSVEVWGIDGNMNGHYLTTFSKEELTSGSKVTHNTQLGTVTLEMTKQPVTYLDYVTDEATEKSVIVEESAEYLITWTGGSFGANGVGGFQKAIAATYLN